MGSTSRLSIRARPGRLDTGRAAGGEPGGVTPWGTSQRGYQHGLADGDETPFGPAIRRNRVAADRGWARPNPQFG